MKTPERPQLRISGIFIVNFEYMSGIFLVLLLLTFNNYLLGGLGTCWVGASKSITSYKRQSSTITQKIRYFKSFKTALVTTDSPKLLFLIVIPFASQISRVQQMLLYWKFLNNPFFQALNFLLLHCKNDLHRNIMLFSIFFHDMLIHTILVDFKIDVLQGSNYVYAVVQWLSLLLHILMQ